MHLAKKSLFSILFGGKYGRVKVREKKTLMLKLKHTSTREMWMWHAHFTHPYDFHCIFTFDRWPSNIAFFSTKHFRDPQIPKSNAFQSILLRYKLTKIHTHIHNCCLVFRSINLYFFYFLFFSVHHFDINTHQLIFYYHVNAATHSCLFYCNSSTLLHGYCLSHRFIHRIRFLWLPQKIVTWSISILVQCFVFLQCSLFILWMKFRVSRSSSFFMSVEWCFVNVIFFFFSLLSISIFYEALWAL